MALYFECRINNNALHQTVFFGDFAHWVARPGRLIADLVRHTYLQLPAHNRITKAMLLIR